MLYYHTKSPSENHVVPSLELILLFQSLSGSVTKVICVDAEKSVNVNSTVVQIVPKKQVEERILHECVPEDWQMMFVAIIKSSCDSMISVTYCRCFEVDFCTGKIIEIGVAFLDGESVYLCGFGIIKQEHLIDI